MLKPWAKDAKFDAKGTHTVSALKEDLAVAKHNGATDKLESSGSWSNDAKKSKSLRGCLANLMEMEDESPMVSSSLGLRMAIDTDIAFARGRPAVRNFIDVTWT